MALTVVVILIVGGSTILCLASIMAELANSVKYYWMAARVRKNQAKNIKAAKRRLAAAMSGPNQQMYAAASAAQADGRPSGRRNTIALSRVLTAAPVDEEAAKVRASCCCCCAAAATAVTVAAAAAAVAAAASRNPLYCDAHGAARPALAVSVVHG